MALVRWTGENKIYYVAWGIHTSMKKSKDSKARHGIYIILTFSWQSSGEESACQCRGHGCNPRFRKIPCALEQLSCNYWSLHKRSHRKVPQRKITPTGCNWKKPGSSEEDPTWQKKKKKRERENMYYLGLRRRNPGEGNGDSLQYSFLENSMDRGVWRAIVHGVRKSRLRQHISTVRRRR